ncbi:MAG: tyrosine-type recombinase/integrase [FCB group bacterium]|nr:tyrosine-type recombinase/integrase [FCB group bacterium]MBL7123263.1 tyrosine-type recombinase/integrase [Candidatus Neomarinimicrobiota bacterium]
MSTKPGEVHDANLHTLRKTAGARLIQKGVDIYRVSKFLGHSSVKVTERHYVDLLEVDYQDMSALLEDSTKDDSKVSETRASGWGRVA